MPANESQGHLRMPATASELLNDSEVGQARAMAVDGDVVIPCNSVRVDRQYGRILAGPRNPYCSKFGFFSMLRTNFLKKRQGSAAAVAQGRAGIDRRPLP